MEVYEVWLERARAEVKDRLQSYLQTNRTKHQLWTVKHYIIVDFLTKEGCTPGFIEPIAELLMEEFKNEL